MRVAVASLSWVAEEMAAQVEANAKTPATNGEHRALAFHIETVE